MSKPKGNGIEWIEGLRGVASLMVMTSHVALAFWPWANDPALNDKGTRMVMQWPILRTLLTGMLPVAMFVVVSGVVNSLKPLRQTRAGHFDEALSGIALSTFRRTGRFVFPVFFLTAISWAMCQVGLFQVGHASLNEWVARTSPGPSPTILRALYDLIINMWTTWSSSTNAYDENMWLLLSFLMGSFSVYLILLATIYVYPAKRFIVYTLLYSYCFLTGQSLIGMNIVAGLIISEIIQTGVVQEVQESHPWATYWTSALFVFVGLVFGSFPETNPEWAEWTRALVTLAQYIFPQGIEVARCYPAIGAQMIFVGILFNTGIQHLLTAPWILACGKVSWQIYLVHGTLLRTIMMIMTYSLSGSPAGAPMSTGLYVRFCIALPAFYVLVYFAAKAWAATIDPLCSRITDWIEKQLFRQDVFNRSSTIL